MSPPQPKTSDRASGDREIHRLFDGELSPAEREALLAGLDASELRGKLEGLGEVRAVVRALAAESEAEPIDGDAMWAGIAARIEGASAEAAAVPERAEPARRDEAARPALRVLPGRASAPAASSEASERERQVRSRRTIMMVVGGLAAAAAAAIAYLGPSEPGPDTEVVAIGERPESGGGDGQELAPLLGPSADEELRRTEVLAVDFGANTGTVFSVEGTEGSRYAVVWLTDEAEKAPETGAEGEPRAAPEIPDDTAEL